ncbi:hypothetical protein GGP78_003143 [Salinibacter ruber]|jgi:hypothetical protein|nr:hypothetical protein [Salinibacter ruber]MCS4142197.1 hypothetical protein [Salinibacter ruber]
MTHFFTLLIFVFKDRFTCMSDRHTPICTGPSTHVGQDASSQDLFIGLDSFIGLSSQIVSLCVGAAFLAATLTAIFLPQGALAQKEAGQDRSENRVLGECTPRAENSSFERSFLTFRSEV